LTIDIPSYVLNFGSAVALALIAVYVHRKLKPEAPPVDENESTLETV
jgi:uncharacterized protein YoxC